MQVYSVLEAFWPALAWYPEALHIRCCKFASPLAWWHLCHLAGYWLAGFCGSVFLSCCRVSLVPYCTVVVVRGCSHEHKRMLESTGKPVDRGRECALLQGATCPMPCKWLAMFSCALGLDCMLYAAPSCAMPLCKARGPNICYKPDLAGG
jgi:hypothetical protein